MSFEMGSGLSVRLLQPGEVLSYFQELEEILRPAFAYAQGEADAASTLVLASENRAWVFVGEVNSKINTAFICEFLDYPLKRVCHVIAYAGKARDYFASYAWIENWARANGAEEIRGFGTEVTERIARKYGFRPMYRVYGKPL